MRAVLNGETVTLGGPSWQETFPVACLPAKIEFYQRLWSGAGPRDGAARLAKPGPSARHYDETLAELRRVQSQVRA
jgi:hypothetical protein